MAHAHAEGGEAPARAAAPPEPPPTFLDMPCDLLSCLGPVASTPGYAEEMDGTQCLCRAARDDTMLGAATADLRYKARWGGPARTRLGYACSVNDEARVAWLLECGARHVAAAAADGYTGGVALVRRLAADPLVDASEALVAAAHVGVADVVALLVARGAQLEREVRWGECPAKTALVAASMCGHLGVVAALLAAGAAVDAADCCGMTALMYAALLDHLAVVQTLVAAGADVNRRDIIGFSAAMHAAHAAVAAYLCRLPQAEPGAHIAAAILLGDVALVRGFIARGANVQQRDWTGATCLMLAAEHGHVEVVRVLLAAGANVAAGNGVGNSVLTYGVGHPAALAVLLEHFQVGGNAARQSKVNTALFWAGSTFCAAQCDPPAGAESMRLLLAAGADADACGWVYGDGEAEAWLGEEVVAECTSALSGAAAAGNVAAFRLLLDAGADVAGLDRAATPAEEIRRRCRVPEAVPALLAALADAAAGGRGEAR
jgi:ankyrin repeat protein